MLTGFRIGQIAQEAGMDWLTISLGLTTDEHFDMACEIWAGDWAWWEMQDFYPW